MPVLNPDEYDVSYFDGNSQTMSHNAGYGSYQRWYRKEGANSTGEFWKDKAKSIFDTLDLKNKKVLEIASAKGFIVKDLRDLGVDANGFDVSQYCYDQAEEAVQPYLTVGNALLDLQEYKNNFFKYLFSLRYLECVADADMPDLVTELNRISKNQYHEIDTTPPLLFYNVKSIDDWIAYDWENGTVLLERETGQTRTK